MAGEKKHVPDSMKSSAFDELMDWYTLDSGAYDAGVKRGRMENEAG